LGSIHNLRFLVSVVDQMREAILEGTFDTLKTDFLNRYYRK